MTNFQDLVAKVKNLGALAPVLGAISRPGMDIIGRSYMLITCRIQRVKYTYIYVSDTVSHY